MYLTLRKTGDTLIVDVIGNVVGGDGIRLQEAFEKVLVHGQRSSALLVNLAKTGLMDSFGLRSLLTLHSGLKQRSTPLKVALVLPDSRLRSILELVGLHDLFPHFPDEAAALEYLDLENALFIGTLRLAEGAMHGLNV